MELVFSGDHLKYAALLVTLLAISFEGFSLIFIHPTAALRSNLLPSLPCGWNLTRLGPHLCYIYFWVEVAGSV